MKRGAESGTLGRTQPSTQAREMNDDGFETIDIEEPRAAPNGSRTLSEQAYETLRRDIIRGDLKPGSKLQSEMLKARYGFGGSTLREALTRLSAQMLVTFEGQRGFRVAEVSKADFADLSEMRKMVEIEALKRSIKAGDDDWEAGVVAAFHRLSKIEQEFPDKFGALYDEWEIRNRAFHDALISACNSRWLLRMHELLFQQSERYRRITYSSGTVIPRNVNEEHRRIMEAAIARDVDAACGLAASHIQKTVSVLDAFYGRQKS